MKPSAQSDVAQDSGVLYLIVVSNLYYKIKEEEARGR
jgi:hypothetical protein